MGSYCSTLLSADGGQCAELSCEPEEKDEKVTLFERARRGDHATRVEVTANEILEAVKWHDENAPDSGYVEGSRVAGDRFLKNRDIIEHTDLFAIAKMMPKGAHLHIHFNANLLPEFLLGHAERQESMCIWSSMPLTTPSSLRNCRIQFSMEHREDRYDVFSCSYVPFDEKGMPKQYMAYRDFIERWAASTSALTQLSRMQWLCSKLVFSEEESCNPELYATEKVEEGGLGADVVHPAPLGEERSVEAANEKVNNLWKLFDRRTQMMKGLFNYETAFTDYTKRCLAEFVADGVQYAEIRPNFMPTNFLWKDDGRQKIDNEGIMTIIMRECDAFMAGRTSDQDFLGIKVIYTMPRSFKPSDIAIGLSQCLEFKLKWPHYIAGFDLAGQESGGKDFPLSHFDAVFEEFKRNCAAAKVEIPFLFHCGETLDDPTDNLEAALRLKAKRIGHGFALARKPHLIPDFNQNRICLETCPISNEVLGLVTHMREHAVYELLAADVHCTVNSDNGTLFRSTLSHDFYQVMVGRNATGRNMNLHGWKQLILWSIQHASLDDAEPEGVLPRRDRLAQVWQRKWDAFVDAIAADERYRRIHASWLQAGRPLV